MKILKGFYVTVTILYNKSHKTPLILQDNFYKIIYSYNNKKARDISFACLDNRWAG